MLAPVLLGCKLVPLAKSRSQNVNHETILRRMDTAYDRVPYPTATYTQTHVRRLAAIARLFGVSAPDIRACRVLEIGHERAATSHYLARRRLFAWRVAVIP